MADTANPTDAQRKYARQARASMSAAERSRASQRVARRFLNSRYFLNCQAIGCYLSSPEEVDTAAIIEHAWRAKKRVFAPVVDDQRGMSFRLLRPDTTLVRNRFGIWEPANDALIDPKSLDVVLTPLVGFDDEGNRIGMGGGYFDRAFAFLGRRQIWRHPKLIGLAFDCQRIGKISPNPWDIPLSCVITETY
jgi:5-formyltetrahydrofolate cyclo-ligase